MSKSRNVLKWARPSNHRKLRSLALAVPLGLVIAGQAAAALPPGYRLVRVVDTIVNNTDPSLFANDGAWRLRDIVGHQPEEPGRDHDPGLHRRLGRVRPPLPFVQRRDDLVEAVRYPAAAGRVQRAQRSDAGLGPKRAGLLLPGQLSHQLDVVSVRATDPTQSAPSTTGWTAAPDVTNQRRQGAADQPWPIVNRDPFIASQQNTYVGYTDLRRCRSWSASPFRTGSRR